MKAIITIDLENDAFAGTNCGRELARILRDMARLVSGAGPETLAVRLHDTNGNTCGRFEIVDE